MRRRVCDGTNVAVNVKYPILLHKSVRFDNAAMIQGVQLLLIVISCMIKHIVRQYSNN